MLIQRAKKRPELLTGPPSPEALNGVTPRVLNGKDWWDKKRKETYGKSGGVCAACGGNILRKPLEAHEVYEVDWTKGFMTLLEVVSLCHLCHTFIHRRHTRSIHLNAARKHCTDLLKAAGLTVHKTPRTSVKWNDWYLLLDGRKFYPVHEEPR